MNSSFSRHDRLETARATAAFRFHLNIHLNKEDTPLHRTFRDRISLYEQGKAMEIMAGSVSRERFPGLVRWVSPLVGHGDRENITCIGQIVMPAPSFDGIKELITKATGSDWAGLTRWIPTFEAQ